MAIQRCVLSDLLSKKNGEMILSVGVGQDVERTNSGVPRSLSSLLESFTLFKTDLYMSTFDSRVSKERTYCQTQSSFRPYM